MRYQIYDELTQTDDELLGYMANFCQGRTLEMIAENAKHTTRAVTHFSHCNTRYRNLLENFGFKLSRYVFQMKISLEEAPNIPALPQGYRFGKFRLAQDEHTVHELVQQAFAEPSRERQSFEDWKAFMMRPDLFNLDLWRLIWFGEDLVGVCLPVPYPELGWIRQLGVAEKHRRKGLGRTLLLAGFEALRNAGYGQAGLAVNSKNSNAHA